MKINTFENISPRDHRSKPEDSDKKLLDRRTFIKRSALVGFGLATGALTLDHILSEKKSTPLTDDSASRLARETSEAVADIRQQWLESENQQKISITDQDVIGKTFRQQIETQDHITLDKTTRDAIYQSFYEQYKPGGVNYTDGLIAGLKRMQPYLAEIRAIFRLYDVPEEYADLAIAESHFKFDDVSKSGAAGPYQITSNTANLYNLTINSTYDERRDPIKSAELCAKHLRDNYDKFGKDWALTLMDYNGGHTKRYVQYLIESEKTAETIERTKHTMQEAETLIDIARKYNTSVQLLKNSNHLADEEVRKLRPGTVLTIPQERAPITMDNFNVWLQDQINTDIQKTLNGLDHTIKPKETLSAIAHKYHTNPTFLALRNNISEQHDLIAGQKLSIPINKETQSKVLLNILSAYQENINYPEKFFAIRDVITSEKLHEKIPETHTYRKISVPKNSIREVFYTMPKRGNFATALNHFRHELSSKDGTVNINTTTLKEMICRKNNITNIHKLPEGKILTISAPVNSPPSLQSIAFQNGVPSDILHEFNPAILNRTSPLPEKISIRIPLKTKNNS